MTYHYIPLEDFLTDYHTIEPTNEELQAFKAHLHTYLKRSTQQDNEEYQKNEINDFLKKVFHYRINTKNQIDSAIYDDNKVKVIIEAKRINNKNEFPKNKHNPLSKALCESVLYFLREYHKGNNEIKHIILCNPIEFFIFDADELKRFIDNKTIEQYYKNCDKKEGIKTSTDKFYKDLESYLMGGGGE
ncbi:hypothetical protein CQA53_05760 [Helicobacter didelphidarum]|uniref:DUF7149 domain-containing protein n=1 Tax=Helicobacter didelphidarum TaxID=2040648 RepID=A0A3D8IKT8_9HELI|nr:hypothetical protein [Helicobacter didelphidarum]RDU65798.1 hypothetical protein CQA53_05760 [Helicobacter didelphidarum]